MTLLVGAGLFIRTLVKLYSVDTGVRTGGVFVFSVISKHHFPAARSVEIQTAIVDRLRSLPGVTFASAADVLPLAGGRRTEKIKVEGHTFRPGEDDSVAFNSIAGRYFVVTGTPLLLGRDFNERDTGESSPVAIVNETFVRTFFGGQAPLGRHVTSNQVDYEIVGVAKDAKFETLRQGVPSTLYVPWLQQGEFGMSNRAQPMGYTYLARVASGNPMRLAPLVERAVPEIDSAMRIWFPRTFDFMVNRTTLNERIMATLGGFFGLLACWWHAWASSASWPSRFRGGSTRSACAWRWAHARQHLDAGAARSSAAARAGVRGGCGVRGVAIAIRWQLPVRRDGHGPRNVRTGSVRTGRGDAGRGISAGAARRARGADGRAALRLS